jgi:hypothetical protein
MLEQMIYGMLKIILYMHRDFCGNETKYSPSYSMNYSSVSKLYPDRIIMLFKLDRAVLPLKSVFTSF